MKVLEEIIPKLNADAKNQLLTLASQLLDQQANFSQEEDELSYEPTSIESLEKEVVKKNLSKSLYYDTTQLSYNAEDIKAIIAKFPEQRKWVFADLQNTYIFPEEHFVKIEIINHTIYVMPDPSTLHQELLTLLSAHITMFVSKEKLGKTMVAPVSIKLDEGNVVKPDIIFIALERIEQDADLVTAQSIEGVPDLVVEVISPSNYKKVREAKKQLYAQNGVLEYWELKPKKKSISIEVLENSEYQLFSEAKKTGIVYSKVLEGFSLDIEQIFA